MDNFDEYLSPEIVRKDVIAEMTVEREKSRYRDILIGLKQKICDNAMLGSEVNQVRHDIVESWIRSRDYKVNKNDYSSTLIRLGKSEFDSVLQQRKHLITTANSILKPLENIFLSTHCLAFLTDCNGVILEAIHGDNKIKEEHSMVNGAVWREDTVGTCAHGICMVKNYPVQLWGPEHWCSSFSYSTGSAAPIYDSSEKLIGTLTIGSQTGNPQGMHTLALAISLAWAMQTKYQLIAKDSALEKSLEIQDRAIIIIGPTGIIVQGNAKAISLFRNESGLIGHYYEDIFGQQSPIYAAINSKKENEHIELVLKNGRKYLYSVKPLQDDLGCILTIEKYRAGAVKLGASNISKKKMTFDSIIGDSPEIQKTLSFARRIAETDTNVLIIGESGVGKDVLAQAIHHESRESEPFVAVNCAAIPRNLIESELLGYEGGSFTGADRGGRCGKIELADNGTLFLDEIGDMPLEVQPVLLRVLEDRQIMRIGSNKYTPVNFRLIAATNQNLKELVQQGKFRLDLYYRIAVFNFVIPPLRERKADILLLADYFIEQITESMGISPRKLTTAAKIRLSNYEWPGNIRQLQNAMLYAVHMSRNEVIESEHLPDEITEDFDSPKYPIEGDDESLTDAAKWDSTIAGVEKMAISDALKVTGNNVRKAAELLNMSKSTIYRRLKEYGGTE